MKDMESDGKRHHHSGNQKNNSNDINVVIDEAGKLGDFVSSPRFGLFLVGIMLSAFALIIGIYIAITVLDKSKSLPNILTNQYGVIINTEPDKRVCYFLLNSSEYWAQTGIKVEKGDYISIYTSGSYNTAIHHVVTAADSNTVPDFKWITSEGIPTENVYEGKPADFLSLEVLTKKGANLGSLLMKISNGSLHTEDAMFHEKYYDYDNDIIDIGRGKSNIRVTKDGELEFCINEIYLSEEKILKLRKIYIDHIFSKAEKYGISDKKGLSELLHGPVLEPVDSTKDNRRVYPEDTDYIMEFLYKSHDSLSKENLDIRSFTAGLDAIYSKFRDKDIDTLEKMFSSEPEKTDKKVFKRIFELEKYYLYRYASPWYDDNIGSALVVIEIEKRG